MSDLWRSAIHEAGHAVIGRRLGLTCNMATIVSSADEGYAGYATCADPLLIAGHWENRERYREISLVFRGRILMMMAGAESEHVILGGCDGCDDTDREQIDLMASDDHCIFDAEQWARREPRMRAMARMLVRRHRGSIERVAGALFDRKTLSGDEIDALI
jgi:hypothetical protein